MLYGGIFDYAQKKQRLAEIDKLQESPEVWNDLAASQVLNRERASLEKLTSPFETLSIAVEEACELSELAVAEEDDDTLNELAGESERLDKLVSELEFRQMFRGEMDDSNAFLDIKPGSGGTEAQDWAQMLYRMYLMWAKSRNFETRVVDYAEGEGAGIKNVTVKVSGDYAYGWLRTENGIHRLVRKSPFDSGGRRHTSFASVFAYPEIDERIEVNVKTEDLRIDTYRASGAGGQHVNRTDSAVRITHLPTGVVAQCQNNRSQHRNKADAMAILRSRLHDREQQIQDEKQQAIEGSKPDISWGNQIRSYVLDQSRIKDLRTGVETGNINSVLEGGIDMFIEESLKAGI